MTLEAIVIEILGRNPGTPYLFRPRIPGTSYELDPRQAAWLVRGIPNTDRRKAMPARRETGTLLLASC